MRPYSALCWRYNKLERTGAMSPDRTQGQGPKTTRERREAARAAEQPQQQAASARAWRAVVRNGLI
jgi:hypothetical protein